MEPFVRAPTDDGRVVSALNVWKTGQVGNGRGLGGVVAPRDGGAAGDDSGQ